MKAFIILAFLALFVCGSAYGEDQSRPKYGVESEIVSEEMTPFTKDGEKESINQVKVQTKTVTKETKWDWWSLDTIDRHLGVWKARMDQCQEAIKKWSDLRKRVKEAAEKVELSDGGDRPEEM